MKIFYKASLILFFGFFLSACGKQTLTEATQIQPTISPLPTSTPTVNVTSTPIPTITPVYTPLPDTNCTGDSDKKLDVYYENAEISRIGNGQLHGIDWSSDGTKLAIASETGLYIFDANSFEMLNYINTGRSIETVRFSPDGTIIATDYSSKVALWDLNTGELVGEIGDKVDFYTVLIRHPPDPVLGNISFSPDGKEIVVHTKNWGGDEDSNGSVQIWDAHSYKLVREWKLKKGVFPLLDPVFSPDGKYIASQWGDDVVLWDIATGEETKRFQSMSFFPLFSHDSTKLLTVKRASCCSVLEMVDLQTNKPFQVFPVEDTQDFEAAKFSADDKKLIVYYASSAGATMEVRDVKNGKRILSLPLLDYVFGFATNPTKNEIVTIDYEQNIHIWDIDSGALLRTHKFSEYFGSEIYPSPDGEKLVALRDKKFHLYNAQTGAYLCQLQENIEEPYFFSFNPNGKEFAYITLSGKSLTWDLTSGNLLQSIEIGQENGSETEQTGNLIYKETLFSNAHYDLIAWGWKGERSNKTIWIGTSCDAWESLPTICSGVISRDGNFFATYERIEEKFKITIYSADTHNMVKSIDIDDLSDNFAFSPDGEYILSLRFIDWAIDIWNTKTLEKVTKINSGMEGDGPYLSVQEFSFTSDGDLLVTYLPYWNDSVKLWNTQTWELEQNFDYIGGIRDAKISGDGSLITALSGYTVYFWHLE